MLCKTMQKFNKGDCLDPVPKPVVVVGRGGGGPSQQIALYVGMHVHVCKGWQVDPMS